MPIRQYRPTPRLSPDGHMMFGEDAVRSVCARSRAAPPIAHHRFVKTYLRRAMPICAVRLIFRPATPSSTYYVMPGASVDAAECTGSVRVIMQVRSSMTPPPVQIAESDAR